MKRIPFNTCVDFLGDFPLSLDSLPGKEAAQFLAAGLTERGIEVLGIEKKRPDIGYCVGCLSYGRRFRVCVTTRPWGDLVRWQLLTQPATRRGPRSLRGQADLDALAHLLHNLDETIRQAEAIWDARWLAQPEEPDHLDIQEPGVGPVRSSEADARYPILLRFSKLSRMYALLLAVAYYFALGGFVLVTGGNEDDLAFPALIAFATILLYGLMIPWFLAAPIFDLAQVCIEQRQSELARQPEYPWPQATSSPSVNPRLQFSLRMLLLITTGASVLLAMATWIGWWRFMAVAQIAFCMAHLGATFAPLPLILPGMPLPKRKFVEAWVFVLGASFVLHVLATAIVVELQLRVPLLFDLHPYDNIIRETLNWTVPYVAVGLLIAGLFWQKVRSSRTCMAGCGLAAVGLVACVWYGHRFWCHYCGYDLSELSEIVWWA
jgi:hypothetical protein